MDLLLEIQAELAKYRSLEKANKRVLSLQDEKKELEVELNALENKIEKEYKDYERLSGKSIKGLFYSVLGNKEKQLEKERQEYLQLTMKYEEVKESLGMITFEIDVLLKKTKEFELTGTKLEDLKNRRQEQLLRYNSHEAAELRRIVDRQDSLTILSIDVEEALMVSRELQQSINQMIHFLRTARSWGRWDSAGGRGRIYKYNKNSNIDKAKQVSHRIQHLLDQFEREVQDVYPHFDGIQVNFDLDRFGGFVEMFFDNLISDWIVQQRIVNTLNLAKSLMDRVVRTSQSLEVEHKKSKEEMAQLEDRRHAILEGRIH